MHGTAWNDDTTGITLEDTTAAVRPSPRPTLRAISRMGAPGAGADVDPPVGHAAFRGAVIGFVLVTAGMTGVGVAAGAGFGGAIGLGVFVGIWGGVGFGAMLGAARCVARADDDRIAAEKARASRPGATAVGLTPVASHPTTD